MNLVWALCIAVLALGCAPAPVKQTESPPTVTKIEQYGFSAATSFAFCAESDCAKRTVKHLDVPEPPLIETRATIPTASINKE